MDKSKFSFLSLFVTFIICWQNTPGESTSAFTVIVDPCSSDAQGNPGCILTCPQGDGGTLALAGAVITVVVKDPNGNPLESVPPGDFWLIGCDDALTLCGGAGSSNADSSTNVFGITTISGPIAASGCSEGLMVVVQGYIIEDPMNCSQPLCLPICVRSPDINGDLIVDLVDFSIFAAGYASPPKPYDPCLDFNFDGIINLVDCVVFALHFRHSC